MRFVELRVSLRAVGNREGSLEGTREGSWVVGRSVGVVKGNSVGVVEGNSVGVAVQIEKNARVIKENFLINNEACNEEQLNLTFK